ncbi:hypothetical protein Fmac_010095 [Flemingia macrophylla]|uniref:FAS1 domain-containing protein n=1 Tax=Flemingia macrophylla TaxID=520843 RepID=A0ABD1N4M6_9FABA
MRCSLGAVWVWVWVLGLVLVFVLGRVSCIPSRELDSVLAGVRARGYNLFCNAIVTSDLHFQLLSYNHTSFTFFAPTDASLFALDMTQTASSYTDTLRLHVVPRRLSLSQLRLLPDGYTLSTLLPHRTLQLTRLSPSAFAVGGVHVASTGLFYGRTVAVHGLAGILSLRSNNSSSPRTAPINSPASQPVLAPFSMTNSPTPVEAPDDKPDDRTRFPESSISLPPEGYSDAEAPAPEVVEGVKKCLNPDVGLEESVMQCYEE